MPGCIVLSHTTYTRLKAYCAGDRAALVAHYGADPAGPILLSESARNPGQPLTKWTVTDVFNRLRAALGLPHLTPHKLRHLMLTHLHRSGEMDLLDIARYGRHKSLASTQLYVHTDTSDLARKLNKVHAHRAAIIGRLQDPEETEHGNR
jgi:integrase